MWKLRLIVAGSRNSVIVKESEPSERERLLGPLHERGCTGRLGAEPCCHQTEWRVTV